MGEVFRSLKGELYALTLWQRLIPLMADILCREAQAIGIDVEEAMRALESDEKAMDDIICMAEALKAKDAGTQQVTRNPSIDLIKLTVLIYNELHCK